MDLFIRSSRTTNYFFLINIHFFDLFSHFLKVPRKGRLYYLLASDEGLVARARDALEDDDEINICVKMPILMNIHVDIYMNDVEH